MGCKHSTIRDTQQEAVAAIEDNKIVRAEQSSDPIEEANNLEKDVENVQKVSITATEELPIQQACEDLSLEDLNVNVAHPVSEIDSVHDAVTDMVNSSEPVKEPEPAEEQVAPKMDVADLVIESAPATDAEPVLLKLTGHTITDTKIVYYTIQTPTSTIQRRYNDFKALYAAMQKNTKIPLMPSAYGSMRLIRSAPSIKLIKHREERFQSILDVFARDNALYSSDAFQQFLREEIEEAQVSVEQPANVEAPASDEKEATVEAPVTIEEVAVEEEVTVEAPASLEEVATVEEPATAEEPVTVEEVATVEVLATAEAAEEVSDADVVEESKDILVKESIVEEKLEMPEDVENVEAVDENKSVDVVPENQHDNNVDSDTHAVE